jgi:DNA-binding MarR family transcriptional regulator
MQEAGLVTREQSAEDRRVWRIRPTEKGLKIARSVAVAPWDLLRRALRALEPKEQEQLVTLLTKVAEGVKRSVTDGSR